MCIYGRHIDPKPGHEERNFAKSCHMDQLGLQTPKTAGYNREAPDTRTRKP